MYTPHAFAEDDLAGLDWLVARDPFATLVTCGTDGLPQATHLPVLYARDGGGVLFEGHWARPNPQATHAGPALLVIHGPHHYISADWYPDKAQAARYSVLHLATHGWLAAESVRSTDDPTLDRRSVPAERAVGDERANGMSPMLLCGLALAGANLPVGATGRIPGLVTAEELSALDLSRCELAVLSACDANAGLRRAGQGIASLQRALHMAGARSVITSLWKVPDGATKELMADFYRRIWVEKKPKSVALWEAKMVLRNAKDEVGKLRWSTRDWAAWVLTGEPD